MFAIRRSLPQAGDMTETWPWLVLAGLGAFHGINPAMGWLFAVALGLNRNSRAVVVASLVPIALGHALSIAVAVLGVLLLGTVAEPRGIRIGAGALLIGWAFYHQFYGSRHRIRVGMRTGMAGLTLWSFAMATAHGAGLMLVPALLPLGIAGTPVLHHDHAIGSSLPMALAAIGIHTLAMLTVTGVIAVVVYEWVGVAFLRRGWINLDRLWSPALIVTGVVLLVMH